MRMQTIAPTFILLLLPAVVHAGTPTTVELLEPSGMSNPKPTDADTLVWCDRRARGKEGFGGDLRPDRNDCYSISSVSGERGESPCHNLKMDGSNRMGMWPSKDVNCTVYADDWCRTKIFDYTKKLFWYVEAAALLTADNMWGVDNFHVEAWRKQGFKDKQYAGTGPKSARCYIMGKTAVGLGNAPGVEKAV